MHSKYLLLMGSSYFPNDHSFLRVRWIVEMPDELDLVFEEFANLLNVRFSGHIFTKEDAIRYTFFYSICKNMFKPEDVILEDRHPFLEGEKEIDMRIESSENSDELVFEFQ